jgi:transposase
MSQEDRRSYTAQFKFETVIEVLRGEKSVAQICRERGINDALLYTWKQAFLERGSSLFDEKGQSLDQAAIERMAQLEQRVGRQAMALEILKKSRSVLGLRRNGNE